ncbi:DUF4905 domain-containing protein [Adhaeribacter rhizoryzae]|uniref:DUF4905 domain-containing protein n=1 Tax=Adhaeribacter rhizoryzae TaxID=2607907 RepID=A0A5M6DP21_9BACT|nr:DUF4905 domain-containing protein [Adhaeribacter rhizoryzae]KAA5548176.1 DUF4905 domain-containing protein [Adhaeribacter rhizoryzae]
MKAAGESLINDAGKIAPAYKLEWEYPVWQLRFDAKAGLIAIECCDADTLQTFFGVFAGKTGAFIMQDYRPAKAWWQNLAAIQNGIMYLQGVAAKGVGRSVGITAVNVEKAQVQWQRPEFSFYGLTATAVLALPATGELTELIGLNPATGEELEVAGNIATGPVKLGSWHADENQVLAVPQHYPAGNEYFADLELFIKEKTGCNALFAIDYLEYKNIIALGFYLSQQDGRQTYRLAIFSLAGELYLQEDLGKDLTGIGIDNFFIFQDTLILVKNKKALLGYEV